MKFLSTAFLAVVAGIMLFFAAAYGDRVLLSQHRAESFPHVQGTVLSSLVTTTRGSKGRILFHPSISYRYTVDGVEYIANRYRYDGHPTDSSSAYVIVTGHAPGSAVDVYYNPNEPGDALLSPGVDVPDMNLFLFLTAMALFTMWATLTNMNQTGWPWDQTKVAGGVKVITDMLITRLRLPRYQPMPVAVFAASIVVLLSAIVVAFKLLSLSPWTAGEWSLAIAGVVGLAVYVWQYMDIHSGKRDLVIDEGARSVQLPLTYGRRERTPISYSQIRSVFLNKIMHQTKSGVYYTYIVTLEITDNPEQKLTVLNLARAESLATWLREKLGVPDRATAIAET